MTRRLPWRRHSVAADEELAPLIADYREAHPRASVARIARAYELTARAHQGQFRRSGEPYLTHPVSVARIVARHHQDEDTIISALLHDVVEDSDVTLDELRVEFGDDVASIVDGLTKFDRARFDTKEAQQVATLRKLLIAMATDLRVIVVKLADRVHNLSTIAAMPASTQIRTARETLEVYAPVARRIGMAEMKNQLEDLAFAALHPKFYGELDQMVSSREPERDLYVAQATTELEQVMKEAGIRAEVTGRPKHLYSIYEKVQSKGKGLDEVFDLVGLRVVVADEDTCYKALGHIHRHWMPVPGRFKDYISSPKFNTYQSLHTTVVGLGGRTVEVQIRTREMDERARSGPAAHHDYKAERRGASARRLPWLGSMVTHNAEVSDPAAFLASVKDELERDEVVVFTPKGDLVPLPAGSTPVDFAYAIHTDVGHQCVGARVNDRLVPLNTVLASGDKVEIHSDRGASAGPKAEWLEFVVSPRAESRIKQWFSRERRSDSLERGRESLDVALRRRALPAQQIFEGEALAAVLNGLGYTSNDAAFTAIHDGHLVPEQVVGRLMKELEDGSGSPEMIPGTTLPARAASKPVGVGVHVEGVDDELVRIARCCNPVPPDDLIAFRTRGRGVSVHRADCADAVSLARVNAERVHAAEWLHHAGGHFVAAVEIRALDRPRLIADVTGILSADRVNIRHATFSVSQDSSSIMRMELEMGDPEHLERMLAEVRAVDSVYDARRV